MTIVLTMFHSHQSSWKVGFQNTDRCISEWYLEEADIHYCVHLFSCFCFVWIVAVSIACLCYYPLAAIVKAAVVTMIRGML